MQKIVCLEILKPEHELQQVAVRALSKESTASPGAVERAFAEMPELEPLVLSAREKTAREDGESSLAALGGQVSRDHPSFDSRNDGFPRLSDLIRKQPYLQMKEVTSGENGQHVHITFAESKQADRAHGPG